MIHLILCYLGVILFNLINSYVDAYKINLNMANPGAERTIKHGLNLAGYSVIVFSCCYILNYFKVGYVLLAINSFFIRQIFFDIPLNLRRHLEWNYISTANPPKAIMDRIEKFIFGKYVKSSYYLYALIMVGLGLLNFIS